MSCDTLPAFTSQKTTLPCCTVRSAGSNLNSVMVTLVDPAGWLVPPPQAPSRATEATDTATIASHLI